MVGVQLPEALAAAMAEALWAGATATQRAAYSASIRLATGMAGKPSPPLLRKRVNARPQKNPHILALMSWRHMGLATSHVRAKARPAATFGNWLLVRNARSGLHVQPAERVATVPRVIPEVRRKAEMLAIARSAMPAQKFPLLPIAIDELGFLRVRAHGHLSRAQAGRETTKRKVDALRSMV